MHNCKKLFFTGFVLGALLAFPSLFLFASDLPGVIELGNLGNLYETVIFDHEMHTDMGSCATCHHHTAGMVAEDEKCAQCHNDICTDCAVACADCHYDHQGFGEKLKESGFHIDNAGLKRAYHLKCLGCHKEMDAPSGCQDCHLKRAEDDAV